MNAPPQKIRLVLGFLLAPVGVQSVFVLSAIVECLIRARFCIEGIVYGGFATSIFVFPATWLLELFIGIPVIAFLFHLGFLRAWAVIGAGVFAGALVYLPIVIRSHQQLGQMGWVTALYGALFGGAAATVVWVVAFRQR